MSLRLSRLAPVAALLFAAGCDTGQGQDPISLTPGSIVLNPATGLYFVVDPNLGGQASSIHVQKVVWGRLVDVWATDGVSGNDLRVFADFLIGPDIEDDADFELDRNPITGVERLTILHDFPSDEFDVALARAQATLQPIRDKSLDPGELPPFSAIPRNAAMAIALDDLLDDGGDPLDPGYPGSVMPETVKVRTGYPPSVQFEARVLPDRNFGDLVDGQFHSTRVLIDFTVSQLESTTYSAPINGLGLPASINLSQPSAAVRIPTRTHAASGQLSVLTNLRGSPVSFGGNGSTDPYSATLDVVRAFRAGGATSVTGDPYNGFLPDEEAPVVLGAQTVTLTAVDTSGTDPLLDFTFDTVTCAVTPRQGDVLDLPTVVVEVIADGGAPSGGAVYNVPVRLLAGSAGSLAVGAVGQYRTPWSTTLGVSPACFVAFSPPPGAPPAAGVSNLSSFAIRFSEPMDPDSVRPFETLTLGPTTPPVNPMLRRAAGSIAASADLTHYVFAPAVPLSHVAGGSESYTIALTGGAAGVTDLAGNALATSLPATAFTLAPGSAAITSGAVSFTFSDLDEDGNGARELRGQFIYDLARGRIRPRSVTRFSGVADLSEPIIAMMPTFGAIQYPLTRYGCRLATVWRYHDLGFRLLDDATLNIDVEGLNWAPATAGLSVDTFPQFQMALAHCKFLPDEEVSSSVAVHPLSGLSDVFADQVLDPVNDPLTVVHQKALGYTVQPLDLFVSATGTPMAPWPMNRDKAPSERTYWTWRDTAKTAVGQPGPDILYGIGADYRHVFVTDPTGASGVYPRGSVPTIGLPLLLDLRVFPNALSSGSNTFLAANANADPALQPYFSAYSAGGVPLSGPPVNVDPDQATLATGSADGNLAPRANIFYLGQGDFVVRVNRIHTAWLDTGGLSNFVDGVIDPPLTTAPPGTLITLAYRGAAGITGPAGQPWTDAALLDPYGNALPGTTFTVNFTNGNAGWVTDVSSLAGSRFIQVRVSILSNVESGVSPELTSMGFPFYR